MAETYKVLSQRQTVARQADDTFGPVMRITFRTGAGVIASVDVPTADYNVDTVKAAIEERVIHADEIANL